MKDMTSGSPIRLILGFALPMFLGNFLQQLYNVADAAIVGQFLGPAALAAVGSTSSVQFLIFGFCIGSSAGFCVPIAQRFGAKDYTQMRRLLFNGALLTAFIAVILTAGCAIGCSGILRLLSTPDNIWADTHSYIFVIFLGIPFTLLYNLSAGILRAVGDSKTPFLILAVSTISNIFLDLACISVLHWGCMGAAIATVTSQAFSGVLCTWLIFKKYEILRVRPEERRADSALMKNLVYIGVPMGLQFSITAIGSMIMQSANNALGSVYISAFTAGSRLRMFAMCPFDAIASGVTTFCSQNYGAGNMDRIRQGHRIGCLVGVLYGFFSGVLLVLFGRTACLIFLSPDEVQILDAASLYLRRGGCLFWVLGILNITRMTVQGLGYSARAMLAGVMEMFTRASIAIFLVPLYGFNAISVADPAAWVSATVYIVPTCYFVFRRAERTLSAKRAD